MFRKHGDRLMGFRDNFCYIKFIAIVFCVQLLAGHLPVQATENNRVLSLDGNGGCVLVSDDNAFLSSDFTIEASVRVDRISDWPEYIMGKGVDISQGSLSFYARQNHFLFGVHGGMEITTQEGTLTTNVWTHVAGIYDVSHRVVSIVINGALAGIQPYPSSQPLSLTSKLPLTIGAHNNGDSYLLPGEIDEMRFWNKALTLDEIKAKMLSRLAGTESNLVAYWTFDDSTANDRTGHGHNGILTGSASTIQVALYPVSVGPPSFTPQIKGQNAKNGSAASFIAEVSGLPPLSYQWFKNGIIIPNEKTDTLVITSASTSDAGIYSVIVSNSLGMATNQAPLTVTPTGFSSFTVTRTNVTGPGSLPVIIAEANATPGDCTVEFAVSGTITLVSALPTITNNLTFNGRIENPVIISGGGNVPIFTFAEGTTNFLNRIFLINGNTATGGAAINNTGTVYLTSCLLTNNNALDEGGAIKNDGAITIISSELSENKAAVGGAVYNSGNMKILTTRVVNNEAGNGGALYNVNTLFLEGLNISRNRAKLGFGGGVFNSGQLFITACDLSSNIANGFMGSNGENGAVGNTLYANGGGGGGAGGGGLGAGGGIYSKIGAMAVTNCSFSGNIATGGNGGNGGNGGKTGYIDYSNIHEPSGHLVTGTGMGGNGGDGAGNGGGMKGISSSTPINRRGSSGLFGGGGGGGSGGNGGSSDPLGGDGGRAGFGGGNGGQGGSGYGNGGSAGDGGSGHGAGIFLDSGNMVLVNDTFADNAATGGAGGTGGTGIDGFKQKGGQTGYGIGGGVYNLGGNASLLNTIIAGNTAHDSSPDLLGSFLSSGFNLIGNSQGATGLNINDFQNVSANLGPLQNNGGPTLTHALLQGSLAIGGGTSVGAPRTDQRGILRPVDHVDIGAFQLVTLITPAIAWNKPLDIIFGTPLGPDQLDASLGVDGVLAYTPPAGTLLSAGSNQVLSVVFTPSDLSKYTMVTNSVTIDVLKANQTITFDPIANKQFGDPPVLLNANASSGLPVMYQLISGPATLTGNLLTFGSTSGLVTVRATQAGNTNFNAAPTVDQSFVLGIVPLPLILGQPKSQTVNAGDRVIFSVNGTNGPLRYQWRFNQQPINGESASTLVLARVRAVQAGPYDVIVSNPSGSVSSLVAKLTVNVPAGSPIIDGQPQNQNARANEAVTIAAHAIGAEPMAYQWYEGLSGDIRDPIISATNATYLVLNLTTNGVFWVNAHNSYGTADSESAVVTIFPANAAKLKLQLIAGQAGLTIDGTLGTSYRIEYSSDLLTTNWTKLFDLTLPYSPFTFFDTGATVFLPRYYRAVIP